jgi:hypothetical protein
MNREIQVDPAVMKMMGPSTSGNSCFLDVVILSLLVSPTDIVHHHILAGNEDSRFANVRRELLKVRSKIYLDTPYTLQELRGLLAGSGMGEDIDDGGPHDASEVLYVLSDMFHLTETNVREVVIFATNDTVSTRPDKDHLVISTRRTERCGLVHYIPVVTQTSLDQTLAHELDSGIMSTPLIVRDVPGGNGAYYRMIERAVITSTGMLVLHLNRKTLTGFDDTSVDIPMYVQGLPLRFIIVFKNGHYITFIETGGVWYVYDGMRYDGKLRPVRLEEHMSLLRDHGMLFGFGM